MKNNNILKLEDTRTSSVLNQGDKVRAMSRLRDALDMVLGTDICRIYVSKNGYSEWKTWDVPLNGNNILFTIDVPYVIADEVSIAMRNRLSNKHKVYRVLDGEYIWSGPLVPTGRNFGYRIFEPHCVSEMLEVLRKPDPCPKCGRDLNQIDYWPCSCGCEY